MTTLFLREINYHDYPKQLSAYLYLALYTAKVLLIRHFRLKIDEQARIAAALEQYYNVPWTYPRPESPPWSPLPSPVIRPVEGKVDGDASLADDRIKLDETPASIRSVQQAQPESDDRMFLQSLCRMKRQCLSLYQSRYLTGVFDAKPKPTSVVAEVCIAPDDDGVFSAAFIREMAAALLEAGIAEDGGAFSNDFITDMKAALPL
ncbi:hypothetical protein A0J61_10271 [Choanephora cucurbitarum]|uniref:Uncharacterized protein n=1 Tax=Choanephora cucurbitarum TaxID=101091 RepID=A0A1C7MXX3_9FUNG|nr:hypothetical protein A0J61_10271 [Choanephora cucurbitarum]